MQMRSLRVSLFYVASKTAEKTKGRRTKYICRQKGSTLKFHKGFLFISPYCGRGEIGRRAAVG